jgi:hypothetical protein
MSHSLRYTACYVHFGFFLVLNHHCNGFDQRAASNSYVNTVQHATVEEAVFSVDLTDAPIDWLDSDHVIRIYCRSMSCSRA